VQSGFAAKRKNRFAKISHFFAFLKNAKNLQKKSVLKKSNFLRKFINKEKIQVQHLWFSQKNFRKMQNFREVLLHFRIFCIIYFRVSFRSLKTLGAMYIAHI